MMTGYTASMVPAPMVDRQILPAKTECQIIKCKHKRPGYARIRADLIPLNLEAVTKSG